jgi:DNA-binding CsgD family transcriptional regulator
MSNLKKFSLKFKLTPREAETLGLLGSGQTQKEAAGNMGCSWRTVEVYSRSVRKKMGVPNIAAAVWLILRSR